MTLPELSGKATLNVADFRQGIQTILSDLRRVTDIAGKANTIKVTAALVDGGKVKSDVDQLRATVLKPISIPLELDPGKLNRPVGQLGEVEDALRSLRLQVRTTRDLWQTQIITDEGAARSSAHLRDELLKLAAAEGTNADQVTRAAQAAAQAQRTLDQSQGTITKGGFAFNTSIGILESLRSLGGPTGAAASLLAGFVTKGLEGGLKAGRPAVGRGAQDIGDDIVKALQDRLKIHSPSVVMVDIGRFITEGLVIGIKSNTKDVLDAASGLASGIPKAVTDSFSGDSLNLGGAFSGSFLDGFKSVLDDLPKLFNKASGDAGEGLNKLADDATVNVAPAFEGLSAGFEKASVKLEALPEKAKAAGDATAGAGDAAADAGHSAVEAGNGFEALSGFLAVAATGIALFGAAAAIAVPKAAEFQASINNIGTESDLTQAQLATLGDGLLKLAGPVNQSAQALAKGAYDIIGAGVKGAEGTAQITELVRVSAIAASAGLTDVATAGNVITSALNAYGQSADNAQHVSDVLFKTTAIGKITFEQIAASMAVTFPLAQTLGVSLEELSGSVAVLTQAGVPASQAVTGVQQALSNVLKPSGEATKLADQLGIKFGATALKSQGLAKFLESVKTATKGNVEQMGILFGSTEAVNAVFGLTSEQGAKRLKDALVALQGSAGATQSAFGQQAKGFKFAADQFGHAAEAAQIAFGLRLLPLLTDVLRFGTEVVSNLDKIGSNGVVQFALIVGGGTLAVGTILKLSTAIKEATLASALFQAVNTAGGVAAFTRALFGGAVGFGVFGTAAAAASIAAAPLLPVALAIGAAFAGWKLGQVISDMNLLGSKTLTLGDTLQDFLAKTIYHADPKLIDEMRDQEEAAQFNALGTAKASDGLTGSLEKELAAQRALIDVQQKADAVRAEQLATIQRQKAAVDDLSKTLSDRAFTGSNAGLSQLQQDLNKTTRDFDELRLKIKAAFDQDLSSPKLIAALKSISVQQAAEEKAIRSKAAEGAVASARESVLATQKAQVDAMRDGQPKIAAQRDVEIAQLRVNLQKQLDQYKDFPAQRAIIEAQGQKQISLKREEFARQDEESARQLAIKLIQAQQGVQDAQGQADAAASSARVARIALETDRQARAAEGNAEKVAQIELAGRLSTLKEQASAEDEANRASQAKLNRTAQVALSDTKLTAQERRSIEQTLQFNLAELGSKAQASETARLADRVKAERDAADKIRAARVVALFRPVADQQEQLQGIAFQAQFLKTDAQRLTNAQQELAKRQEIVVLNDRQIRQGAQRLLTQDQFNARVKEQKGFVQDVAVAQQKVADALEKTRAARVADDFKPVSRAQDIIAEQVFQASLLKTDEQRLVSLREQQAAREAALASQDAAILKARADRATEAEINAAVKDRTGLQRDVLTGQKAISDAEENVRKSVVDTVLAVRELARLQGDSGASAVVLAQRGVERATEDVGAAYRDARPYLEAYQQSQSLGLPDHAAAREAISKLTSALQAERSALDALKGRWEEQKTAVAGVRDVIASLDDASGGTGALSRRVTETAAAYDKARTLLAQGSGNDPAGLQKLASDFQSAYQKRSGAVTAFYEAQAKGFEKSAESEKTGAAARAAADQKALAALQSQIDLRKALDGLTGQPASAQQQLADSTDEVTAAYREAVPLLSAYAQGVQQTPASLKVLQDASQRLVTALSDQQAKLTALRGEYDKQKSALDSLQGVLGGFGKELGDKSLLDSALKFNQQTYDRAKAALSDLLATGSPDPVKLQAAATGLKSAYDGLKGSLDDLGKGSQLKGIAADLPALLERTGTAARSAGTDVEALGVKLSQAEKDLISQGQGLDAQTITRVKAQLAPERELERQRAELQASADIRAAASAARIEGLTTSAKSARDAGQAALDTLNSGAQGVLTSLGASAALAQQTADQTGASLAAGERTYGASLRSLGTLSDSFIQTLQRSMTTGGYQAGKSLADSLAQGYTQNLRTLAVPGISGAASAGGGSSSTTLNVYLDGKQTAALPPNIRALLYQLRDQATTEVRRGNL